MELALPYCSRLHLGALMVDEITRIAAIERLWRIDFNGKIFAYGLEYLVKDYPQSLGTVGQVVFYHVDGKGTFTVAKKPKLDIFASLEVPAWAKEPGHQK